MSIIHSALKKVQSKQSTAHVQVTPTPVSTTSQAAPVAATADAAPIQTLTIFPLVLIGLGIVLLILFIIWCLTLLPKKAVMPPSSGIATATATTPAAPVAPVADAVTPPALSPVAIATAITASPTLEIPVPQDIPTDPFSSLNIEGTLDTGGGKVVALINGEIYEEGQTLFGKIIARITPDTLTIIDNGNQRVIPIK